MSQSRRKFLSLTCRSLVTLGGGALFHRFAFLNAFAQGVPDYKALVCVFLFGGNDGNNTVIPYDASGYNSYFTLRGGSGSVALPQNVLLPIQPASTPTPFALHPRLTELQSLFNQGKLAVVANVGPLVAPTTPPARAAAIARSARGFVYYVSVTGVTGARAALPEDLERKLGELRAASPAPVAVGFGISRPEQAAALKGKADGIVVGTALVATHHERGIKAAAELVRLLRAAL